MSTRRVSASKSSTKHRHRRLIWCWSTGSTRRAKTSIGALLGFSDRVELTTLYGWAASALWLGSRYSVSFRTFPRNERRCQCFRDNPSVPVGESQIWKPACPRSTGGESFTRVRGPVIQAHGVDSLFCWRPSPSPHCQQWLGRPRGTIHLLKRRQKSPNWPQIGIDKGDAHLVSAK